MNSSPLLTDHEWSLYDTFVQHAGDLLAICSTLKIRPQDINRWYASPAVQSELAALKSMTTLGTHVHASSALHKAIDELERQLALEPTEKSNPERRKSASMLSRISIAQAPNSRDRAPAKSSANNESHTQPPKPPGRVQHVYDPMDKLRNAANSGASSLHVPLTAHPSSLPREIPHPAASPLNPFPSPAPTGPRAVAMGEATSPRGAQPVEADDQISPAPAGAAESAPSPSHVVNADSSSSSPNTASPPSPNPCSSAATPSPNTASLPPPHLCASAVNVFSVNPTFGLSDEQLSELTPKEKHRLISIPIPGGGHTTYDPKNPFAGFNGDPIDFRREDADVTCVLPLLPGESEHEFHPFVRGTPECPIPDFEIPDLDEETPFPIIDPAWFPKPAPGIELPDNLRDISNLQLSPDINLTIARSKHPWLSLPTDSRGRPHRKRIRAETNGPYAFRKIARALFDARSLACSAWNERWRRAELHRLITLKRNGQLPTNPPELQVDSDLTVPPEQKNNEPYLTTDLPVPPNTKMDPPTNSA